MDTQLVGSLEGKEENKLFKAYDAIANALEKISKWAMIGIFSIMSISVFLQIILRSVFNMTILQLEDIAKYSFSWLIFIGMAAVFKKDEHVAVTFFVGCMPKKIAQVCDYIQRLLVCIFLIFLIVKGIEFTKNGMSEVIQQLRIPAGIFYVIVPITGILSIIPYIDFFLGRKRPYDIQYSIRSSI
jgi:TRAP-type C4-dicarboxylate transport system permease small subunit